MGRPSAVSPKTEAKMPHQNYKKVGFWPIQKRNYYITSRIQLQEMVHQFETSTSWPFFKEKQSVGTPRQRGSRSLLLNMSAS